MKTTRLKINLPTITTRAEAEAVMNDLSIAVNEQRKIAADLDAEILAIKEDYALDLAAIESTRKEQYDLLEAWAESNLDAFPKDRKSIIMAAGTLGFRTGTPKLSLLSRLYNWERVLANVASFLPQFIRVKKEVDKEGILGMYSTSKEKHIADAELKRLGLKVTQEESFFADPLLTDLPARQTS